MELLIPCEKVFTILDFLNANTKFYNQIKKIETKGKRFLINPHCLYIDLVLSACESFN